MSRKEIVIRYSIALCLIFLKALTGVREGTVISAILVGNLVKVYMRIFSGLDKKIFGSSAR